MVVTRGVGGKSSTTSAAAGSAVAAGVASSVGGGLAAPSAVAFNAAVQAAKKSTSSSARPPTDAAYKEKPKSSGTDTSTPTTTTRPTTTSTTQPATTRPSTTGSGATTTTSTSGAAARPPAPVNTSPVVIDDSGATEPTWIQPASYTFGAPTEDSPADNEPDRPVIQHTVDPQWWWTDMSGANLFNSGNTTEGNPDAGQEERNESASGYDVVITDDVIGSPEAPVIDSQAWYQPSGVDTPALDIPLQGNPAAGQEEQTEDVSGYDVVIADDTVITDEVIGNPDAPVIDPHMWYTPWGDPTALGLPLQGVPSITTPEQELASDLVSDDPDSSGSRSSRI